MMQIVEMTHEEKVEMYSKYSKEELIEMLITANLFLHIYSKEPLVSTFTTTK